MTARPMRVAGAGALGPAALARGRERLRADALRALVESLLGREIDPVRESSVMLALQLAGAVRRALPAKAGGIGETLRETALRRLVEAHLGRDLEPGEVAVGLALDLALRGRRAPGDGDAGAAGDDGGVDGG